MKKWLITAVALVFGGAAICFSAAASMHFDFGKLDNGKYETVTYTVKESFRSIAVDIEREKLSFKPSEDGKCRVVCSAEESLKHEIAVADGTLRIKSVDSRKAPFRFSFFSRGPEITVYLPKSVYSELLIETDSGEIEIPADFSLNSLTVKGDTSDVNCFASVKNGVEITLSTGAVRFSSLTAGSMDIKTTTGSIRAEAVNCEGDVQIRVGTGAVKLRDTHCRNLSVQGMTGDVTLDRVIASEAFNIGLSTGSVKFNASDADTIYVKADTGSVTGTLLSEKVFLAKTGTGTVKVPNSTAGGRCEIITGTGAIRLELED